MAANSEKGVFEDIQISPFLQSSTRSRTDALALVHLSRDNLVPVLLRDTKTADDGYAEGAVLNSRFGSFPHSTLIDVRWGTQVRASKVDTGSRGRKRKLAAQKQPADKSSNKQGGGEKDTETNGEGAGTNGALSDQGISTDATPLPQENGVDDSGPNARKHDRADDNDASPSRSLKRRRMPNGEDDNPNSESRDAANDSEELTEEPTIKEAVVAASGYVHILKPTPELWTISLPHRTQVVYTPDYSYILQRIRAFPGKRLIEAGAGSGSFTHAAARAIFNGFPSGPDDKKGTVFSFEFNEDRYEAMTKEIVAHGLDKVVQITHRDVYNGGFLVDGKSPRANCVFLDLPAPWEALHHLSRSRPQEETVSTTMEEGWVSPLDPEHSVHICTFSPCIEQVTKTVETLHELGWTDIDMVEISHKKIIVSRERIGLSYSSEKGTISVPANVEEAVARLRRINEQEKEFHAKVLRGNQKKAKKDASEDAAATGEGDGEAAMGEDVEDDSEATPPIGLPPKPWLEGRLVHKAEPELKTHTSYLVFAILPREWSEEDEVEALARWPCGQEGPSTEMLDKAARKKARQTNIRSAKKVTMKDK